jgi:hypothetical protein
MKWSVVLAFVFGGIASAQQPAAAPALDPNVIDEFQWQDLPAAGPLYKAALGDGSTLRVL